MKILSFYKSEKLFKLGQLSFYLGLFLLPSAFFISAILFLIALSIGFIISKEGFFEDSLNKYFFLGATLIIISSFLNSIFPLLIEGAEITNIFSECSNEIEKFVNKNKTKIKRIIIIEGGNGPFRDEINPIWDWGFHSFALIFKLFKKDITNKYKIREIKKNNINKGLVSKFTFSINNTIKVKIMTGNLFQIKKRLIKIILLNGDFLLCDFIKHEVYFNNILIFRNSKTPLESLLDNFENVIRNKDYLTSSELLDISIKTTKILEKFYKC